MGTPGASAAAGCSVARDVSHRVPLGAAIDGCGARTSENAGPAAAFELPGPTAGETGAYAAIATTASRIAHERSLRIVMVPKP